MAGYLGSVPVPQATQHRETFTATAGQTTFNTAGYTAQFVDVYLNGVHLSPADVTATNGSDVVLAACLVNDIVDVVSYTPFEVANQTFTGTTTMTDVVAATLDISGNIDIDGTTNLDVVDIDGAVDMASTLAVAGVVTANAGVVVDTMTLDAATLTATGDFTVDSAGDIVLDAAGEDIKFFVGGSAKGRFTHSSGDFVIQADTQDKDMIFKGDDGGASITALTLDMSDAGAARFVNGTAALPAVSFISDPNTGMLSGGADNLSFSTGGTIRAFLSATQLNVTGNAIFGGSAHTFAGSATVANNLTLTDGNLVIATDGHGINFSGPTAQSGGTSQTLDSYEEGLFAAVLAPTSSGSIALEGASNSFSYTKIGRLVTVTGRAQIASVSSPSGDLKITGLPFTVGDVGDNAGDSTVLINFLDDSGGTQTVVPSRALDAGTQIDIKKGASGVAANDQFYISFSYITA